MAPRPRPGKELAPAAQLTAIPHTVSDVLHRQRRLQIRFTVGDHVVLDKRTGQVCRNTTISTCRLS